ncbi:MAG: DUF4433 domain-containing protein, partial [Chloroflexota bacterium]|nr:DUF4433 domain-containing protein [Chloroflexota bacterium]
MFNRNYLDGSIYHMVHFDNLNKIFERRALLSKKSVIQEKITYQSIAYETVQNLRNRIFIWDTSIKKYRSLHSYIPFYFATLTPMLYVQHQRGIQEHLVIFELSRTILQEPNVLFTDGNASNQQLSRNPEEKVLIMPATDDNNLCRR